MSILNTMDNETISAKALLEKTGISILDAARIVRNILDNLPKNSSISPIQFCAKLIESGKRHIRSVEKSPADALHEYVAYKSAYLRPDSIRDIKYIGNRLLKSYPFFASKNFSELSPSDCETWLSETFSSPNQFNKARTMLHGLFAFAIRRNWCESNPLALVQKKRVIEKEIKPLTLLQTRKLATTASKDKNCSAAVALLIWAGIRPGEVARLRWSDIDLEENFIKVRSPCSKTGGVRHVEICPALKKFLANLTYPPETPLCPANWKSRWEKIRKESGFSGLWVQDVLRHTYASYHAKYYKNLPRLQLNMGHRNLSLLRSRYVNMAGLSQKNAEAFFLESPNAR